MSSLSVFLCDLKAGHWSAGWSGDEALWAPCFRQDLGSQRMVTMRTGHSFNLAFVYDFCSIQDRGMSEPGGWNIDGEGAGEWSQAKSVSEFDLL